jgi:hypothetical protein
LSEGVCGFSGHKSLSKTQTESKPPLRLVLLPGLYFLL